MNIMNNILNTDGASQIADASKNTSTAHRPYATERYEQFAREVEAAGYTVEHYRGRWFYEGPAVSVEGDEFQNVVRATTMPLQTDELGKSGLVVYPR